MQFVSPILGVITVVAAFLIAVSPLADYGLQIAAFTMVVYVGVSFLIRKRILSADIKVTLDILVFSLTISLLIFTTGGFASPVFFLSYFLLFGVTLFSSPITATAITVTFALLFIVAPKADFWMDLLQMGSLLAIAPLSVLFGRQYIKVIADKKMITGLNQKVQKDKIDVTTWTEGDFRRRLLRIQEYLQKLGQDPSIELDKKERINSLYRQIYDLFLSGRSLEKKI
ncbi:MAG: hypothetical protein UV71_C0002G0009 [Microgenomates group bacterium GW2011_GWC1_43_13]|uniref:Uncharacterized protein n=2 Tax=Candidatus Woeseibacteriota TaxID=1752722 RepID=A0A1F8DI72_9BACT|nr:MAG: hypothetical protein UV71_C0002G0009 [Microgenomates group bacterium GW2011_GWC1_43_13]KKT33177.1 MAG: hypothetical protein UW20_C0004G0011 [Candidatus Woesebacteria bacterium GW2011_GWB1_44_11]OGM82024.1 MAG: hypothetical protein A2394_02875 [Candidatus Woesebacteria bacterium RIFOXYB1_FULL_42_36]OGM84722.1 MAG: hypothetical protein A2421_02870 [Candidatus Woesebacteria bacterium RIFOXYC1_FULL_43_18]OGM87739.1 MAG: hypothetical protein A2573_00535 [Candidatus Woesebacteria bacterium RI